MPEKPRLSQKDADRRDRRIGFFAPAESEYVQRLMEGVLRFQADRGGFIRDFRFDAEAPENQLSWETRPHPWKEWKPHGLVVHIAPDPGLPEWVNASGCPVVNTTSLNVRSPPMFPTVYISLQAIHQVAIDYFESLHYAHFAYVTCLASDPSIPILQTLLKRHKHALCTGFLPYNPAVWDGHKEAEAATDPGVISLLRTAPRPLAVIAINDDVGRVVCLAADRLGLSVPHDVAVLGVKNLLASRTALPPLSSIHLPGEDVGYRAAEMLWQILDGKPVPDRVELPPGRIVIRQSTSAGNLDEADIVRARQIIRDRACEGVSVNQILEVLHISRSTLQREFSAAFGHGPREEMSRVRLDRAKELLRTTTLPIARIARMTGFSTSSIFAAFFRKQTRLTPRAFRASLAKS